MIFVSFSREVESIIDEVFCTIDYFLDEFWPMFVTVVRIPNESIGKQIDSEIN